MSHAPAAASGPESVDGQWDRKTKLIVLLCFVLNMVDGMDVLVISFIAPALQTEWGVSPAAFSIVFSTGLAGIGWAMGIGRIGAFLGPLLGG